MSEPTIISEKSKKLSHPLTRYFGLLLMIALYYLWYRYPFKINSTSTSPTYSDTPFFLSILKYILFLVVVSIYAIISLCVRHLRLPRFRLSWWILFVLTTWVFVLPSIVTIFVRNLENLEAGIFLLAIMPLILYPRSYTISMSSIERLLRWFVYINTTVSVLQIILFITIGRLPALAYGGTLLVRFGGLWDDPNGMAVFLSFIIPFIYFSTIGRYLKVMLILINFGLLIATQSFTGIFAFFASLLFVNGFLFLRPVNRQWARQFSRFFFGLVILATIILMALVFLSLNYDLIGLASTYFELKKPSMIYRLQSLSVITQSPGLPTILGLEPLGWYFENGYVDLFVNLGIFVLLAYVLFLIMVFIRIMYILRDYQNQFGINVFYGAAFFSAAYSVGMLNLPLQRVFPLNMLFIIFALLAFQSHRIVEWQGLYNSDV